MIIPIHMKQDCYDILVERGALSRVGKEFSLNRRALIVTDSGVPAAYAEQVADAAAAPVVVTLPQGEESKSLAALEGLLSRMLHENFTRKDCVVAVGGGVVGDLAGFAAAVYMRGIDFYNIPTTLLSQIDSSIGGKTAVNLGGIKNIVGAFYQPKKVLIDPDLLKTLPPRQLSAGLAEAIKMALTSDEALFRLIEEKEISDHLDEIITASLLVKKGVVEQDEKESGLRKILNFGHTIGHGIESEEELHRLYHGECVALGMIPFCGDSLRPRLLRVLKKVGLPTSLSFDRKRVLAAMLHDKKADRGHVTVITVDRPGSYEMKEMTKEELEKALLLLEKQEVFREAGLSGEQKIKEEEA